MDIISFCIKKPVTMIVAVIFISLFGFIALHKMPYQLTPSVIAPTINIKTTWSGATPYEIEREILDKQEQVLKGLDKLVLMESRARTGQGTVNLEFELGTDLTKAMLDVSNKLAEVKNYPQNVDKPTIKATGEDTPPVVWAFLKTLPENTRPITEYRTFFNEQIIQFLERVDGVAEVVFPAGTNREMHITLDEQKLVAYNLTIEDVIAALDAQNVNMSAGTMDLGSKNYRVRLVSEFKTPEDILNSVLFSDGQMRIYVKDIANVTEGYEKMTRYTLHNNVEGLVIQVKPQAGANVIDLTNATEAKVKELNDGILKDNGLYIDWARDSRVYILQAIALVKENILVGSILAAVILFAFLRSFTSTLVITLCIPISVLGTFIVMGAMGRTLNVVSMAGISFAVGMLMDAAIVVLENIDRHRKLGEDIFTSAYLGTKEVMGAVIASTLTTVAIFIPVLLIEQEAGQLFKDIAISASCAVLFSAVVSILIIPMFGYQMGRYFPSKEKQKTKKDKLEIMGSKIADWIILALKKVLATKTSRWVTILGFTLGWSLIAYLIFPKMDYLPEGNQNFVQSSLVIPPGLSFTESKEIGDYVFLKSQPYMADSGYAPKNKTNLPPIQDLGYVATENGISFWATSSIQDRAGELIPFFKQIIAEIPGVYGSSGQQGIFEKKSGSSRSIDIDVRGEDLNVLVKEAQLMLDTLKKDLPNAQIRPKPALELLYPEINFYPNEDRLQSAGLTAYALGVSIDVLISGRKIGEFKEEGRQSIDLILKTNQSDATTPEDLYQSLIYTKNGSLVPISSVSELKREYGMSEIRRYERMRTITLQVKPSKNVTIEESMDAINQTIDNLRQNNSLTSSISLSGSADTLTKTRQELQWGFLLAILITYLLMAVLYSNFVYPLIILLTIPVSFAGGIFGVKLVDWFMLPQTLDILTMLGFIILIGTVVNNPILIVYRGIDNMRAGMDRIDAIVDAVKTRLRPIYISTFTALFGMLPLVVVPGAGSEVYRGIGSVILGGLSLGTVVTIFLVPCLLYYGLQMEKK